MKIDLHFGIEVSVKSTIANKTRHTKTIKSFGSIFTITVGCLTSLLQKVCHFSVIGISLIFPKRKF